MPGPADPRLSRFIRDDLKLIDERCDLYEREWQALGAQRIEDYLGDAEGELRTLLWLELVMVDQQLRRKCSEVPTILDYKDGCPDERILLELSTDVRAPVAAPRSTDITPHDAGAVPKAEDGPLAGIKGIADPLASTAGPDDDNATRPVDLPSTIGAARNGGTTGNGAAAIMRPGSIVGDYVLLELLAEGGMGTVFKARQITLNRIVALKTIKAGALASHREVRMFQREAEAVAALDHPNIVPILETGEHGGLLYYSMKLIAGKNLQESLARFENQPLAIARLVARLAAAIDHAHQRGLLHRDLKPSNILVDDHDEPHVIDFGLAQRLEADSESTAVSTASAVGTPSYMAPEQAMGLRDQITICTDVYGLGTILYALLTGRRPFHADTAVEILRQVIDKEPARPRAINPKIHSDLETICLKCLEKDPKGRYTSARELADELGRWCDGKPILARPASMIERLWKYIRRHPVTSASIGLVLLTASLGSGGILWQWGQAVAARAQLQVALGAAQLNAVKARKSEDEALKSEDYARHLAYAAKLNLAMRDWHDANVSGVVRQLEETRPLGGKTDLRGFEWFYLDRLSRSQGQTLAGHTWFVWSVVFSPDGRRLASASSDGTAKLWDAATGQFIRTFTANEQDVYAVAFHPDGARLASSGRDPVVRLWDAATGQIIRSFTGHTREVREVVISPDGKALASSSLDGTVKSWDIASGSVRTVNDHHAGNSCGEIAFSPDGKVLASAGGGERSVRLWDAATGAPIQTLKLELSGPFADPAASPEGNRGPVVFSPDGKALAAGLEDGGISLWDAIARTSIRTLRDSQSLNPVTGLAFSPDSKALASVSHSGQTILLWDLKTGSVTRTIKGHISVINRVAFSPDGTHLVSASGDDNLKLWDLTRDQEARSLRLKEKVRDVAFGHDGSYLVSAGHDQTLTLWDLATGQVARTFPGHAGVILSVAISPDGRRAVSAGDDKVVRIWDVATGKELHAKNGHTASILHVATSPDGKTAASASSDRTIKLWDLSTGREIRTLTGHLSPVRAVQFSKDGKTLASAGKDDGFVIFWDLDSGRQVRAIKAHVGGLRAMALSPDGHLMATATYDPMISVWDLATGQEIRTLKGHVGAIFDLAFSPDGRRLASAADDGTVRIWDPVFGQELIALRGHVGIVTGIAFSPDGMRLASASSDRTVKIWDASASPNRPENLR
jgi:eukaryotic-like serine/threonine-protein kinase